MPFTSRRFSAPMHPGDLHIRAPPMRASSPHTFPHPNADLPIRSRRSHIPFGGFRISPYHGATLHANARSPIGPASSTKSHTVPAETSVRFTQTCASNRLTQIPCNKGGGSGNAQGAIPLGMGTTTVPSQHSPIGTSAYGRQPAETSDRFTQIPCDGEPCVGVTTASTSWGATACYGRA